MNNVISLSEKIKDPDDLMSFRELEIEHGYKYGYLYKWACLKRKIKLYPRGVLKLSEKEVVEFDNKRLEEKYGRNK